MARHRSIGVAAAALVLLPTALLLCFVEPSRASEELFVPAGPLTVDTWTNATAPWFSFPEVTPSSPYFLAALAARPSFGVAISGGGYRAATTALGYVRALHELGLLQRVRYLSSNSGGSWFNAAFSYQDIMPVSDFLGPYVAPQNLTLASLKSVADKPHGDFAAVIASATIRLAAATGGLLNAFAGEANVSRTGGWTSATGKAFLAPYSLGAEHSTISANGTKGAIHQAATGLAGQGLTTYFYQGAADRLAAHGQPFPIIVASVRSNLNRKSSFYPFESTPEYVGVPPAVTLTQLGAANVTEVVGGGFVEPLGLNSKPPAQQPTLPPVLQGGPVQQLLSDLSDQSTGQPDKSPPAGNNTKHRHLMQASAPATATAAAAARPTTTRSQSELGLVQTGVISNVTNAATGAVSGAVDTAVKSAAGRFANQAVAALGAAQQAADAARNAALPGKVSVESVGVVPLKALTGISSGAFAQALGMLPGQKAFPFKTFVGTESLRLWNQVNFSGNKLDFTDGGATDNFAIMPLVRRKVRFIIACISNAEPLTSSRDPADLASKIQEASAVFGAVPRTSLVYQLTGFDAEHFNKMQVFPSEGWSRLVSGLINTTEAGGPTHHLDEYEVMDNPLLAVQGGWKVKMLWVFDARQSAWEQQLPVEVTQLLAATRKELKRADLSENLTAADVRAAGLEGFPYISTTNADYTPQLTGMLSQQTTWQLLQLKALIEGQLLGVDGEQQQQQQPQQQANSSPPVAGTG